MSNRRNRFSFHSNVRQMILPKLTERDGIIPAPYLARYKWVGLRRLGALGDAEMKRFLKQSYEMVLAKLPKKARDKVR